MARWLERQQALEEQEAYEQAIFGEPEVTAAAQPPKAYSWAKGTSPSVKIDTSEERKMRFEMLPTPLPMHVSRAGGCKKWAFGSMKSFADVKSSGFYPENTNVTIVAIAYVPVIDDGKAIEAAYYMDALAMGDFAESGKIKWAIGYMHADLAEGHSDLLGNPVKRAEAALEKQKKLEQERFDKAFIKKRLEDVEVGMNAYKKTRRELIPHTKCIAFFPDGIGKIGDDGAKYVWVHDYDARRPDRKLFEYQEVTISHTFEYKGSSFGQPEGSAKNGIYFGIPLAYLQSEDDLHNTKVDAQTRVETGGRYTWSEKHIWVPLAKYTAKLKNKQRK